MDSACCQLLLIEDSQTDDGAVREHLTNTDEVQAELTRVERLSAALARLVDRRFDAVLVDVDLADGSGVETVAEVHRRSPQVPIVALTGSSSSEFGLAAVKAGAVDYVSKDHLVPRLLVRTIRYAIEWAAHRQADDEYRAGLERTLRASEQRYLDLLAAVRTYTYTVTFVNGMPTATRHTAGCIGATGYSPEDYAADPNLWFHMIHLDDRERVQQYVARMLAGEKAEPIEHRIFHKNGSVRWIRNTIVQRRDETDRLVGYDGLVEDVTERRAVEEMLRNLETQLLAAELIQARLWPKAPPVLPGFDVAGASYPAEFAAGDYFDYFPMLDGSIGFVIGDVMGHGLGSAIVMALAYAHLRSLAHIYHELDVILTRLNQFLATETDHFVTLLFGQLMPSTRTFAAVNAGHPPGFVLDSSGKLKTQIPSTMPPLGVVPNAPVSVWEPLPVEPGDLLLLYTDGIPEARSPQDTVFGKERMLDVVRANQHRSAVEVIRAIHDAVHTFCRPLKPLDDLTAIVIKVGP
ncbi:MAG: SpoIIE family protein phosphatase [Pirellulaceae bacterium]|jgi:PAS domain S-box-containing protein|nr:SpoIIE family protein phosphatase [Pirellulaceae bacterium]